MPHSLNNFSDYITQALKDWHIPGAAVAVIKDGKVLHSAGHGLRDIDNALPVTENTRFPIASMTKPFPVMGVGLLVDEGLLDWDQPIRDVMPEFRLYDDYATQHATLRDLLSHRTGLPRHDGTWYGTGKTRVELIEGLRYLKPNIGFRSLWQYNNLMYETAGHLCAKVSGYDCWETFLQEHIINKLGLESTTPNEIETGQSFTDIAQPYRVLRGTTEAKKIPFYINDLGPAGSMHSTLNDMVSWLKIHTQNGLHNGEPFISPINLQQMHTPHMLMPATPNQTDMFDNNLYAYGLGWFIEPYQGRTLIHHGGNIDGFSLMAAFVPQDNIALVVLTNVDGKPLCNALMYEAVDRALNLESRDWSQQFLKRSLEAETAALKANAASDSDRVKDASASHPL
jgi:CubicO group peptidase (beta-lactamase class C family)